MEKSILKRFKRAGKNAIATALVLGLGSGVFAGCGNNSAGNLYELNEEMYDKFFVSEDSQFSLSEEDYELAKEGEEILTELFSNEKYFGGMVGDFDSITLYIPTFMDEEYAEYLGIEAEDTFFIRTFNDGAIIDYKLVVPSGYIENAGYTNFAHILTYINAIKDLIDSGTLTKDDFKLISYDLEIERMVRQAIEKDVIKDVRKDDNIKECIDAGYDFYLAPQGVGVDLISVYDKETADLDFKYVVFRINSLNFVVDIYQPLNGKGQTDVKVSVLPKYYVNGVDDYGRDIFATKEYGIDFEVKDEKAKQNIISLVDQFLDEYKKTEMYEQSFTMPYELTGYMFESHGMKGELKINQIGNDEDFYNDLYNNVIIPIFELSRNGKKTFHNENKVANISTQVFNDFYLYDIVEGNYNNSCILSNKESRPKDESNTWVYELGMED